MANVETYFPSKYLKASDLNGSDMIATIAEFGEEKFKDSSDVKPIIALQETKPLVLNKTNFTAIQDLYGNTENWAGKSITLFPAEVLFRGESVQAVRVRKEVPTKTDQEDLDF